MPLSAELLANPAFETFSNDGWSSVYGYNRFQTTDGLGTVPRGTRALVQSITQNPNQIASLGLIDIPMALAEIRLGPSAVPDPIVLRASGYLRVPNGTGSPNARAVLYDLNLVGETPPYFSGFVPVPPAATFFSNSGAYGGSVLTAWGPTDVSLAQGALVLNGGAFRLGFALIFERQSGQASYSLQVACWDEVSLRLVLPDQTIYAGSNVRGRED